MSERAEDDVRGEQRRAARQQLKQQQIQRGEGSTAMATVAERRSLPSPEIMLGQSWSSWLDGAKLHGNDGEFALPARRCRTCASEARWERRGSSPSCSLSLRSLADWMQFFWRVDYEETLPVAPSKCNYWRPLSVLELSVFPPQVLNRRKVSKTSGKIERPCVCAEKVSGFLSPSSTLVSGQRCVLILKVYSRAHSAFTDF